MLLISIFGYLITSIAVGLWMSSKIKTTKDFAMAGQTLSFPTVVCMTCVTWFGAEALISTPNRYLQFGLAGTMEDPFGGSLALVVIGVFFARKWYTSNYITIADLFHTHYGSLVETFATVMMGLSYIGWGAAQIIAIGAVLNIASHNAISLNIGMLIGISVVIIYTSCGGLYSIAINDFYQMLIILVGLLVIMFFFLDNAGGFSNVIQTAYSQGKLNPLRENSSHGVLELISALLIITLGSIPQQDIYQRVMSAKNVTISVWAPIIGGIAYLFIALIPLVIIQAATIIEPEFISTYSQSSNKEMILPLLIMYKMPMYIQILFFGALVSAIMSTASASLLAPSILIVQNIIKPHFSPKMSDKKSLYLSRFFTVIFGLFSLTLVQYSIFDLIVYSNKIVLSTIVVPLIAALFWKKSHYVGALCSIFIGLPSLFITEICFPHAYFPPTLISLTISFFCMILPSYLIDFIYFSENKRKDEKLLIVSR